MRPFSSFYEPFHRGLARQIDQLRDNLDRLCHRLRDTIIQAVSQAAARAVQEVLASLAGDRTQPHADDSFGYRPRQAMWHDDQYHDRWQDDLDEPRFADDEVSPTGSSPPSKRLASAVAIGLRIAAWVLQSAGRFCMPMAIGAGLIVAAATYAGGPLVAAGAGCAGSLACLLSLDHGIVAEPEPLAGRANW